MAKQTFTTGQVLTAAQMTSLQQTAMLGGDASVKVASYTLVAADAGTAVAMNSASTTTITVNTGLFAAGDTVFIQNRGAGVCTVTAGTATVNTSASLALAQYEGGTLYFTSASAALFFKAGGAAPAGGGLVFINKTDFTASSAVNINDVFSTIYDNYRIMIVGTSTTGSKGQATIRMRVSGSDTSTNYVSQKNAAYDTNLIAARNEKGTDEGYIGDIAPLDETDVISLDVYRPFLSKETTWIGHNFSTQDTFLVISGFSQTDKTSFTGFSTLFTETSTGSIYSYGYAKA